MLLLLVSLSSASCGDDDDESAGRDDSGTPPTMDASRPTIDAAMDSAVDDARTEGDATSTRDAADTDRDAAGASAFGVRFFRGDRIEIELPQNRSFYMFDCPKTHVLEKAVLPGWWTALIDDRPQWPYKGYYLDEIFIPMYTSGLGCDVMDCVAYPVLDVGRAVEYVQTGMRAPPEDADYDDCVPPELVPVIETRAVHGMLRARFAYSMDDRCQSGAEAIVEIEVPEQGVCCPIAEIGSGTNIPGGGWAPSPDACWNVTTLSGIRIEDARGCPVLISQSKRALGHCADGGFGF